MILQAKPLKVYLQSSMIRSVFSGILGGRTQGETNGRMTHRDATES